MPLIYAGADETLTFTVRDSAGALVPVATLQAITFTLRVATRGGASAIVELTPTATADGQVSVTLSDAQTAALAPGVYDYQLISDNSSDRDVISEGQLTVCRLIAAP